MREHLDADDPHHRLWLPGRKWMAQRTLSRTAAALLPTPRANEATGVFPHDRPESMDNLATRISRLDQPDDDPELLPTPTAWLGRRPENAMADPERAASREHDGPRGKRSLELPEALAEAGVTKLPTPTSAVDSGSRNLEGSKAHAGVSLTDAIKFGNSTTPRLMPTPQAADGDGGRQERGAMERGGKRPSGHKGTLTLGTAASMREEIGDRPFAQPDDEDGQLVLLPTPTLYPGQTLDGQLPTEIVKLPTPVANPDNPGAGGELRAAVVHGEDRRNETGVDTLGRPNHGRRPAADEPQLLPTPRVTSERNSRKAMVENEQWSSVSLAQAAEIARGILPREFASWDEVPGELGRDARARIASELLPTPTARDDRGPNTNAREGGLDLPSAARLLPTPQEADGDRTSEQQPRHYADGADNPTLLGAARRVEWGVYDAAIRRWEDVSGREAPPPTDEKGRLDPPFVEWMLGYPEGWFDVEGLKRTAALRALGNSVQVQCGEAVGGWLAALLESGLLEAAP